IGKLYSSLAALLKLQLSFLYLLDAGHLLYNGFQTIIFSRFGVLQASLFRAPLPALIQYSEPISLCQLLFPN
ncbi:hypothetical protein, partial [Nostoc sp.]